jgi:hypothetical protein
MPRPAHSTLSPKEAPVATVLDVVKIAQSAIDAIPDKPLGSAELDATLLDAPIEESRPIDVDVGQTKGTVTFGIKADARARALGYNSVDDKDEDGLLTGGGGTAPPIVAFDPAAAWVKLRLEASARASAGADLGKLGFALQPGVSLVLMEYRKHLRSQSAREAIAADLLAPRFAVRLADVLALSPGDAVAMQFAGSLTAGVTVAWSDVFLGSLDVLASVLPAGEVLPIQVDAKASVDCEVKLDDEFLLVFAGVQSGATWRVSVKKARSRSVKLAAGVGVTVAFKDPKQVEAILGDVLESVLGAAEQRIRDTLRAAVLGQLTDEERKLLEEVTRRLGATGSGADLAARVDKLVEDLRSRAREAVERAAKAKVELAFRYEYSRVSQDSSVLQAVLDGAALHGVHAELIRGRIGGLLDLARVKTPGVAVELFLGQKIVTTAASWGLSLGFDRWKISGKDKKSLAVTIDRDITETHQRVAYVGARGYEASWLGRVQQLAGDLSIAMDAFSAGPKPRLSEYRYGLHLLVRADLANADEDGIREALDTALIWDVLSPGELDAARRDLQLARGGSATIVTQMRFNHGALRRMLDRIHAAGTPEIASALAASMPYVKGLRGRDDIFVRRAWYAPLWNAYLNDPHLRDESFAAAAARYFRNDRNEPVIAALEERFPNPPMFTAAGVAELNPSLADACHAFQDGLRTLAEALVRDEVDDGLVPKVFDKVSKLWDRSLYIRAAGVYLRDLAAILGLDADVERSAMIRYAKQVVVLGAAR